MIAPWMAYIVLVSVALGTAALLGERVLLRHRLPARIVWAVAMAGAAVVPAIVFGWSTGRLSAGGGRIEVGDTSVLELVVPSEAASRRAWIDPDLLVALDRPLAIGWITSSVIILLFLAISAASLRRRQREWVAAEADGGPVWISDDLGPAVVGFLRATIVVPRWIERLTAEERELLLTHEREHLRSGDPRLVLFGLAMIAALPWNPVLWWQFGRMRAAIEIDCDRRVLRRSGDVGAYGRLLLETGRRTTRMPLAAAAFSRPATGLERRIRAMVRERPRGGWAATLCLASIAVCVALASCGMDQPEPRPTATDTLADAAAGPESRSVELPAAVEPTETPAQTPTEAPPREGGIPVTSTPPVAPRRNAPSAPPAPNPEPRQPEPAFVATEFRPQLRNASALASEIERRYPAMLKDAGIGGTTTLWIFIGEEGQVLEARVYNSSGYEQLDGVATQIILDLAEFTPARNGDRAVAVWTQLPITFRAQ